MTEGKRKMKEERERDGRNKGDTERRRGCEREAEGKRKTGGRVKGIYTVRVKRKMVRERRTNGEREKGEWKKIERQKVRARDGQTEGETTGRPERQREVREI